MQYHPTPSIVSRHALPSPSRSLAALVLSFSLASCAELPLEPVIPSAPAAPATPGAEVGRESRVAANPMTGATFYVNPYSSARKAADAWRGSRPADAALLDKIAAQPQVIWLGDWYAEPYETVQRTTRTIAQAGALPVYALYAIPQRDCGWYAAGGLSGASSYGRWISEVARAIGTQRAAVILEPDALAGMDCLSERDQEARVQMLREAVEVLGRSGTISVYIDAGNARWHTPATMAERLKRVGIDRAAGFSLNVSNYIASDESIRYGSLVSELVDGKHFVIDTGRNGAGATADSQWCNPAGRALGARPTTATGHPLVDAFLWVKPPGESDGECNGGPSAGTWWPEYALGLARRAAW